MVAAGLEALQLGFGKLGREHLLDPACAYQAGQRSKDALFTVLAGHER